MVNFEEKGATHLFTGIVCSL